MTLYSDENLCSAANSSLSPVLQQRLSSLNQIVDFRQLTAEEEAELAELINLYDLAVLRRAKAMAVLARRGYVVQDEVRFADPDEDWLKGAS